MLWESTLCCEYKKTLRPLFKMVITIQVDHLESKTASYSQIWDFHLRYFANFILDLIQSYQNRKTA